MKTNAWITLENTVALAWRDWLRWFVDGKEGPEPPLDTWSKNAVRKLVHLEYSFQAYKKATIQSREWRLLSVWNVTEQQLNAGYTQLGDAEQGGDYGVVGYWTWQDGDNQCALSTRYPWRPAQVIKYMPDECTDPPECTQMAPANQVWDVNLLLGQPPRELPLTAQRKPTLRELS